MRYPSKITSYQESIFHTFVIILKDLKEHPLSPIDLYNNHKESLIDAHEFLTVLDCLYTLKKVNLNSDGELIYAG